MNEMLEIILLLILGLFCIGIFLILTIREILMILRRIEDK